MTTAATLTPSTLAVEPLITPYTVVIDTREQLPFSFTGYRSDACDGSRPLAVQSVRKCLTSGDYSLLGYETRIAVERKSIEDCYNTLSQGRRRFQNELERLGGPDSTYSAVLVVIEAGWDQIMQPQKYSRLLPKTVHRSIINWQLKYPKIHWWPAPSRAFAEVTTLRWLERWWKIETGRKRLTSKTAAIAI